MACCDSITKASATGQRGLGQQPLKRMKFYYQCAICSLALNCVLTLFLNPLVNTKTFAISTRKSSYPTKEDRITYSLHRNGSYHDYFNLYYRCPGRKVFPPILETPGVFDFATQISLHGLKIIVMGDSVGVQFAQGLDEAVGTPQNSSTRHVLKNEWGTHAAIVLNDLGNGNAVATYRLLGMLGKFGENHWRPNQPGRRGYGGWLGKDVVDLFNHSSRVKAFDAMVFRIPHGWISLESITEEKLEETVALAHELFGVSSVIFVNVPFSNNIQTTSDFQKMTETNDMIRKMCQEWNEEKADKTGVKVLMTIELGKLVDDLMRESAISLGYNISNHSYWIERLTRYPSPNNPASVVHVCAERPVSPAEKCTKQNGYSLDGMHYCMPTIGGRLYADIACLLGCAYNGRMSAIFTKNTTDTALNQCAAACNWQFMSVQPVEESMYFD